MASHCFCPQQASERGSYQPGKTQTAVTMTTSHQPQDRYLGTQTEDPGSEMGLRGRVFLSYGRASALAGFLASSSDLGLPQGWETGLLWWGAGCGVDVCR